MSGGENNNNNKSPFKVIGCRITEEELQKVITPVMHDCYQLGLITHPTVSSFVRFCINFWMAHYRAKKQEFAMREKEIEEEKKKLAAIAAEKEACEKSTRHVIQKAAKGVEELEEELDRGFENAPPQQQPKSKTANSSLEDMMA